MLIFSWLDEMNNVHEKEAQRLEGVLDSTYLFSYAFFMFFRCHFLSYSFDFWVIANSAIYVDEKRVQTFNLIHNFINLL